MRKFLYMIQKNPRLTQPWPARWRTHGALGMTRPLWAAIRRYAQHDPIPGWFHDSRAQHSYDGVGMMHYNDVPPAYFSDDQGVALHRADERRIFTDIVPNCGLMLEETVLKKGTAPFKVFSLVRCSGDAMEAKDEKAWHDYGRTLLAADIGKAIRALSLSIVLKHEYTQSSRIKCHGLGEFSFDDLEDAAALFASSEYREIFEGRTSPFVDEKLIGTRENVFYDLDNGIDEREMMISTYLLRA